MLMLVALWLMGIDVLVMSSLRLKDSFETKQKAQQAAYVN